MVPKYKYNVCESAVEPSENLKTNTYLLNFNLLTNLKVYYTSTNIHKFSSRYKVSPKYNFIVVLIEGMYLRNVCKIGKGLSQVLGAGLLQLGTKNI